MDSRIYQELDFQEVCQHLYDGIHITDGEGRILFINNAYTRTTGIQPEQILGRQVSEIEGLLYQGSVTGQVLKTKKRVNSVATILGLNKEVLVTGTPVFDSSGNVKLVVTNTRDFPELKRLEQQLHALTEEQRRANEELAFLRRRQAEGKELIYRSKAMESVMQLVRTVAQTDVTVLITGESGTGKELIANELYQNSQRRGKPFIKVNCAAIPAELLESELFGYEEGAFTGARKGGRKGKFQLADGGTIFLDEIGDMPLPMQAKLLRVLQEREIDPVGGREAVPVDVRIISATRKDLVAMLARGEFREDLYYRLNVINIEMLPLRHRKEDIAEQAVYFLNRLNSEYQQSVAFSKEVLESFQQYEWPGNIRELDNVIKGAYATCDGVTIDLADLPWKFQTAGSGKPEPGSGAPASGEAEGSHTSSVAASLDWRECMPMKERLERVEYAMIQDAYDHFQSVRKAASCLGMSLATFVRKRSLYSEKYG